jgi:hypothetical protein
LLMYREFIYFQTLNIHHVRMLAVLSESVGNGNVEFLDKLGIASVWKSGDDWEGSSSAIAGGLTSST